jgi:DNA-binding transcriptional ArsR family regulator
VNINTMKRRAKEASTLMSAMSNEKRLLILCQLANGERSVTQLARTLEARPSTVSQHLALLRKDGLVQTRRDAQTHFYSLADTRARTLVEALERLYCAPARSKRGHAT